MPRKSRRRYEYRAIKPPTELTKRESANPEDRMSELGREGWRLVETIAYDGGGTKFLIFERPLGEG